MEIKGFRGNNEKYESGNCKDLPRVDKDRKAPINGQQEWPGRGIGSPGRKGNAGCGFGMPWSRMPPQPLQRQWPPQRERRQPCLPHPL
jgi:hypothetical protein